ncbi:MAG TPA: DNA polymerase, partial [Elusimicrobiota bacterium]|nr:DNA polymerase [Elusimicrobiota bacterium]
DRNAPVPFAPGDCRYDFGKGPASEALLECLRRYEFNALLKELGGSPAPAPESAAPAAAPVRAAAFKKVDAEGFVKKVQKAGALALAASVPAQPDLLDPATVTVGAASEEGEAALFPEKPAKARAALGALLESGKALAVAHDVKALRQLLAQGGLSLRGPCFDTFLAAYCLNPSRGKYPLSAALEEAGAAPSEAGPAGEAAALWSLRGWQEAQLEAKGLSKLYRELELPLLDVLAAMEEAGIAVDVPYLERLKKEFESAIAALKKEMDGLAGAELNVNSPKQLAKLFYEDLKLPVLRKTATGAPSTDEESLQALADKHPLPAKIIEYRELAKLKSTYIEALLAKADKAGRVHTHFNQAGAATGRLSSIDPNLQNIPVRTALGQKIRRAFVAEKGQVLLSADYSQIDLRVLAHLSADPALCEAFRAGGDIHLRTAAEVFGVPPEEVDKEMRRRAKAVNFGIVYGQGPFALGQQLGIPFGEAKRYIELYFKRYAGVSAWTEANLESARKEGLVRTLLGRIRYVPDIAGKGPLRAAAERVAGNTPIQGGSADIIKAAMVAIHRKLPKSGFDARMILQVHDELLFELPKKEAPAFGKWVRREMEHAVELKVPVVVDLKAGPNWADMEALTA